MEKFLSYALSYCMWILCAYSCRFWGWYAFSLIATMDSKPKFWIIIKEKLYRCVWFDLISIPLIKHWSSKVGTNLSMIDLCKNMYNIVNLQTFNNILELFTILTRGQVLCYEYQHENKGYSKLRYPNVFKQTFTFVTEFICKLINYFDFFVTNLAS